MSASTLKLKPRLRNLRCSICQEAFTGQGVGPHRNYHQRRGEGTPSFDPMTPKEIEIENALSEDARFDRKTDRRKNPHHVGHKPNAKHPWKQQRELEGGTAAPPLVQLANTVSERVLIRMLNLNISVADCPHCTGSLIVSDGQILHALTLQEFMGAAFRDRIQPASPPMDHDSTDRTELAFQGDGFAG